MSPGAYQGTMSKLSNKKMNIYEKKDHDFTKLYEKTLTELREHERKHKIVTPEEFSIKDSKNNTSNTVTPRLDNKASDQSAVKKDTKPAILEAVNNDMPLS